MKPTIIAAVFLAATALSPAQAVVVVHTSAFIGTPTHYNGFEGIGQNYSFPSNTPYTEDTITVEYVGRAGIWTNSQVMEGLYSWYENGGGSGYTSVKFGPTNEVQFAAGSGWYNGGGLSLQYEVLNAGSTIASGTIPGISGYRGFGYYGFSGMTFDELHLQVQAPGYTGGFDPTAYEAGAYDAFTTGNAVPEPASWALMIAGFGMMGTALRRRRALATA